ncbi:uncharacterized protein [Diadema antillarum]|uniref:uncharacterized protein n=1 Tax=Diadema antillarum TaxID=105358 RepID=UPI003A862CE9
MDVNGSCRQQSLSSFVAYVFFLTMSLSFGRILSDEVSAHRLLDVLSVNKPFSDLRNVRAKRSVGFSRAQQTAILNLHNEFRGTVFPPAANMEHLTWNDELAEAAKAWSQNCTWGHGPVGSVTVNYGQNVWLGDDTGAGANPGVDAVRSWYEERRHYNYQTNGCTGDQCSYYTQLMWASSKQVGCGMHLCPNIKGSGNRRGWFVTCNYSPLGNYIGAKPYIKGQSCTKCESGQGTCEANLCKNCTTSPGSTCECKQVCHCGGVLNENNCTCTCPSGYFGTDCSKECKDNHPLCGKSPGWPGKWTCKLHPQIPRNCPKMCQVCTPADGNTTCVRPTDPPMTSSPAVTDSFATNSVLGSNLPTPPGPASGQGRKRPTVTEVPCVDRECKNGIVRGTDCSCACIVGYEGRECQHITTELDHGVIFYLNGNMNQWEASKSVVKALIAMALNAYCSQYPTKCCLQVGNLLLNRTKVPAYINGSHVRAAEGFPVRINDNEFKVDMLVHPPRNSPICTDKGYLTQGLLLTSLGYQFASIKASLRVTTNFTLFALEGREIEEIVPTTEAGDGEGDRSDEAEKTLTIVLSTVAGVTSILAITIIVMAIHKCLKKKDFVRPGVHGSTKSGSIMSVLDHAECDDADPASDEIYHNRAARMESATNRVSRTSNLFKMSRRSWLITTRKQLRRKLQVQTSEGKLFPH